MKKTILLLLCRLPSFASAGYDFKWRETGVVLNRDGRGQAPYAMDDRGERYGPDIRTCWTASTTLVMNEAARAEGVASGGF